MEEVSVAGFTQARGETHIHRDCWRAGLSPGEDAITNREPLPWKIQHMGLPEGITTYGALSPVRRAHLEKGNTTNNGPGGWTTLPSLAIDEH